MERGKIEFEDPTFRKVDDTARGLPMTSQTAFAVGLELINQKKPRMACCPKDGEPLISTLKYRGAEFVCMVCGGLFGFLAPVPKDEDTRGIQERYAELLAKWEAGDLPPGLA